MMVGVGLSLGIVMTLLAISQAGVGLYTGEYLLSGADLYVVTHGGTLIPILPAKARVRLRTLVRSYPRYGACPVSSPRSGS